MNKLLCLSVLAVVCGASVAQESGRVISSTPVFQQVAVPHQVCSNEAVITQPPRSGAGALMGALAGGAIGNAIGQNSGRAAATMIGLVGGAILGERVEGGGQAQTQNVQRCGTQTTYENRTAGYNVVYEFAGKQYSVQMPNDPGPNIRLQVTPVGGSVAPQAQQAPIQNQYIAPTQSQYPAAQSAPIYDNGQPTTTYPASQPAYVVSNPVVYSAQPVYYAAPPAYYSAAPYIVPIALSVGVGYALRGGFYGGHYGRAGHWR